MDNEFSKPMSSREYTKSLQANNTPGIFKRHTDSVLCCSIDERSRLAVSGGIDDTAFVWDVNTNHVIFECVDHKESVVAAAFSINSTYVATGDLNGYIQVRNTTTGIKIFEYDIDEINWILWHNSSDFVLFAGTTKGDIWMWNVNDPTAVKTFASYGSSCTTARLLPDGLKIVAAYADGALRAFDLKTKQCYAKLTEPNTSEIISIDINLTKSILAMGCLDSTIRLLTLDCLRPIGKLACKTPDGISRVSVVKQEEGDDEPMQQGNEQEDDKDDDVDDYKETCQDDEDIGDDIEIIDEFTENTDNPVKTEPTDCTDDDDDMSSSSEEVVTDHSVESIRFSPCGGYVAAANNSGTIIIWDVSTLTMRCERHTKVGITRALWTDRGQYITGCLDGRIRVYDLNLNELRVLEAHRDQILDLALKNGFLISASEDMTCRVSRV